MRSLRLKSPHPVEDHPGIFQLLEDQAMVILHLTCANKARRPIQAASSLLGANEDAFLAGRPAWALCKSWHMGLAGWLGEAGMFSKLCSGFVKALPCFPPGAEHYSGEGWKPDCLLTAKPLTQGKYKELCASWHVLVSLTRDLGKKMLLENLPFACHALGCVREAQSRSQRLRLFILQFLACGQWFRLNVLHQALVIVLIHFLPAVPDLLGKQFHSVFLKLLSRKQGT